MALAFHASQKLDLPVVAQSTLLEAYLQEKDRVIKALLDPRQLSKTGQGNDGSHLQLKHLECGDCVGVSSLA